MRIQELTVEVRDENLNRVGQFLPVDLVGFSAVNRFNNVGTWEIVLPANHTLGNALATPGAGIIITHSTAGILLSGPTTTVETVAKTDDPVGTVRISGVDDSAILAERLAYPTWTTDDVTLQTSAHDSVVSVKASTAMYTFVKHNLVSGIAPTSRAVPNLVTATDSGLGSTLSKKARFDILGQLLTEIAVIDGLGFDIKQKDNTLQFEVFTPTDRSGYIRMDIQNNTLASSSYGYGLPGLTHAIVAGQGDLEDRQFIQVTTPESTAAQDLWNRRIEQFIDQRNTDVVAELTQAGLEALAESGATLTSVDVVPSSDTTMRFGIDWNLGDTVTVVVGGQEVSAVVTQVALSVQADGIHMVATVGEPLGVDYDALIAKSQVSTMKRIDALERVEGGAGGGGASLSVSDTPPVGAAANSLWLDSKDASLMVRIQDADSTQWVQVNNGSTKDAALTNRVTSLEGVRPVSIGGTGASSLTAGGYLKGAGTGAITSQTGIPATDISSGSLSALRMPPGTVIGFNRIRTAARSAYGYNGDVIISDLNISITPKSASSLLLVQWQVMYESDYNSVFRVYRDNGLVYTSGYQGYNENDGNTWSGVASLQYDTDVASTPSNQLVQYFVPAGSTNTTTLQLSVRSSIPSAATFYLNRSVNSAGTGAYEIGVSTAVIWEIAQ